MQGRTTLVIAHRLSTISLADRVVLIENGQIVADGRHAELLETSPLYAEVLAQVEAEETDSEARRDEHVASRPSMRGGDIAPPTITGGLL